MGALAGKDNGLGGHMFHWSGEKEATAKRLGQEGKLSNHAICKEIGCHSSTLRRFFADNGISHIRASVTGAGTRTSCDVEKRIINLAEGDEELKHAEISERVGVSTATVSKILRRNGIGEDDNTHDPAADRRATKAHLSMLRTVHGDRRYDEDPRSIHEFPVRSIPLMVRTIPAYLP
jgi:transposase-like protein